MKRFLLILAVLAIPVAAMAAPKILGGGHVTNLTRVGIPQGESNGTKLTISGGTPAEATLTKGQAYRIWTNVTVVCEWGDTTGNIAADSNSTWALGANSYDFFYVFDVNGVENDAISCDAQDGSSSGITLLHPID